MKKVKRLVQYEKVFIVILASLSVFFNVRSVVNADDYPTKPINVVVPVAPGGPADQMIRMITPGMEKVLKTPIVIQYKVGGGGTIGFAAVSKEKPDGYTLGTFTGSLFIKQYGKEEAVMVKNLDFVGIYGYTDKCLAVLNNSPFKNLKDLLDYAKKNPGKVTVSNSGTGADAHLPAAAVENAAGVKFTHVPMVGDAGSVTAMLGGHVDVGSFSISAATDHIKSGKVRALGVGTEIRLASFPDIPTYKEQGIDFQYGSPQGLFGPKGIPENRLKILSDAIGISFQSDQYQKFMLNLGHRPVFYNYKQVAEIAKVEDEKARSLLKLVNLYYEKR
jgi:tripartite-type tricarboxylate transporter receptor subunit TctC